ncbi:MAG: hydantoinase B/oxoprolinase family protein [Thalassobaculum sp.]
MEPPASVVEEQAQVLVRTAFSTSAREAGDISAGVFDVEGRMLAQAVTRTPVTSTPWPPRSASAPRWRRRSAPAPKPASNKPKRIPVRSE